MVVLLHPPCVTHAQISKPGSRKRKDKLEIPESLPAVSFRVIKKRITGKYGLLGLHLFTCDCVHRNSICLKL